MYIMDDVLDLMDSLGETLEKGRRGAKRVLRGEGGFSTLVTVLVILALGAIIITPLLSFVITGQRAGRTHNEVTDRLYAADTGIQDGMWRVANDELPPEMQGTWGNDTYNFQYTYTLPNQVNDKDVSVTLQAVWLLEGLESFKNGRQPHGELVTVGNVMTSGQYKVVIIDNGVTGQYKLERIGVWLPAGFTYTPGSSNLEKLNPSDPAYIVPTVADFKNGHTVIWDYDASAKKTVNYTELPSETPTRRVITFNYTPGGPMANAFSWCRTNRNDIYLSWSGDLKQFQIEATATNPDTGHSTTVIAANMKSEAVTMGVAVNGDYAATGNALMRDYGNNTNGSPPGDGLYRERLYKYSKAELTGIPDSGTPRKIMLYWTGWKSYPMDVWYHESTDLSDWTETELQQLLNLVPNYRVDHVSLTVKIGLNSYPIAGSVAADWWQVVPNADNPEGADPWDHPNGWVYSCYADVTDLVKNTLPVDVLEDFNGEAEYQVGHAELGTAPPIDDTLQGIWGSLATDVYVVGDSGTIVHYDGSSWNSVAIGVTSNNLKSVWGSSSSDIWAVGDSRKVGGNSYYTILHSTDSGVTWTDLGVNSGRNLKGIWGSSGTDIWAVGDAWKSGNNNYYTILHTTNGGSSWANTATVGATTPQTLYGVWGPNADYVYAVGANGTILRYTTASGAWAGMTSGTTVTLRGVWGAAWNDVYAVGTGGTILHYNGTSWAAMVNKPSGFTTDLYGVWGSGTDFAGGDVIYAVGASGKVLECRDGINWTAMTNDSTRHLYGAWGSSATDVYAVGEATQTAGTLLHYDGNVDKEWVEVTGGFQLYSWTSGHTGETPIATTDYRLGDNSPVPAPARHSGATHINPNYQSAYAAWSVVVIYTSPETAGHQIYLYDTLRSWLHYEDKEIEIEGFLAPASVATEDDAARITCFVGEGDDSLNGDNMWLNGDILNDGSDGVNYPDDIWNSKSNIMSPSPDGLDIDTFSVAGSSGMILPGDSEATLRMNTQMDVWYPVYIILSFRSDLSATGLLSYIVL